jgi:hypothetical protein
MGVLDWMRQKIPFLAKSKEKHMPYGDDPGKKQGEQDPKKPHQVPGGGSGGASGPPDPSKSQHDPSQGGQQDPSRQQGGR